MIKKYKVALPFLLFNYFFIVALTVVAVLLLFGVVFNPALHDKWFALLWAGVVLVFVLPYGLQIIHTVSLDESGRLVFKSLLFQKVYEAIDLKSITTNFGEGYFLHFRFRKFEVDVLNDICNLTELLQSIRGFNPSVQMAGLMP